MTRFLRTSKSPRWPVVINLLIAIAITNFLSVPVVHAQCGEWYDWATLGISCVVKLMTEEEGGEEDKKEEMTSCGTAIECYQKAQEKLEQTQALLKEQHTKMEQLLNKQLTDTQSIQVIMSKRYENIRAVVPRKIVDNQVCPTGSKAAHVPLSYQGKSGHEICAANRGQEKSCQTLRYLYLKSNNRFSTHFDTNKLHEKTCQLTVPMAWPWGISNTEPTTVPDANAGSTWVVCCQ